MPPNPPIRVQIISDLHTEFGPHAIPQPEGVASMTEIVVIAGDIAAAQGAVQMAASLFPVAPVPVA